MFSPFEVVSVNVSDEKGTPKRPVERITLNREGVVGDAHRGAWHRQVSVLSQELIDAFSASSGRATLPGEFAENVTVRGLDLGCVAPLDRFRIGSVVLQATQIGKACHGDDCVIFREVGRCIMPEEGIFCRVIEGGDVVPGAEGVFEPRPFKVRIITMSDRASAGAYADRSGPRLKELLDDFFEGKRWHLETERVVLPDEASRLREAVYDARHDGADIIFTTGGTGVGPRDIVPETIESMTDRLIPGIMEHIRLKYGAAKPNALLSRSVAAMAGTTQIYALPGSVRAVEEYMSEILKVVEHVLLMAHGVDAH